MSTRKRTMKSLNQKVLYSLLEKKRTQINTQIPQQREKNVWQSSKWCLFRYACSAFDTQRARDRQRMGDRQRERERDREGGREEGMESAKKKKNERTKSMLEERVRPLANPIEASFFPLFPLQLYLSLPLHALFLSIASECASAKLSPPIWHRVPDRSANTYAWRAEWEGGRDGGRVKETERERARGETV